MKLTQTSIAEMLLLIGLIAIVIGFFLINVIAGVFAFGIALLLVGYLLLKVEAIKKGGG